MPFFDPSPFAAAIRLLSAGVASYFFGSANQSSSPCRMHVTSVALAANVATLGVMVYGGDTPAVGSLLSTAALVNAEFNVVNQPLTAVNMVNGTGTVSFALAGANQATTPDAGRAVVPVPMSLEAIANGSSIPVAMPNNSFGGDLDNTVTVQAFFGPTPPTAATITLQGSMVNQDSSYQNLGVVATVANGAVTANGLTVTGQWLFYRVIVSGVNGNGSLAVAIEA